MGRRGKRNRDRSCDLCGLLAISQGGTRVDGLMPRTPRGSTGVHVYTFRISTLARTVYICAWCLRAIERAREDGTVPRLGGV